MDDLLGPTEEPVEPENEEVETDWAKLKSGVTVRWLAGFLRMDDKTVRKRLSELRPVGKKSGYDVYDPQLAMTYLVKPRMDSIKDYIRTMSPNELPPMLRKEFWDAENKRLNYLQRSGELWRTEDVFVVLAEAFKQAKNSMQIWPDELQREVGLSNEQYRALVRKVDDLRDDMFRNLVDMPKTKSTGPVLEHGPLTDDESDD